MGKLRRNDIRRADHARGNITTPAIARIRMLAGLNVRGFPTGKRKGLDPRVSRRLLVVQPKLLPVGDPRLLRPVGPQLRPGVPCGPQSVGTVAVGAGMDGEADAEA